MLKTLKFEAGRDLPAIGLARIDDCDRAGRRSLAAIALRFERLAIIDDGQWWRLVSGHFVHLGWPHLWLNLAGCLLVWFLFRRDFRLVQWLAGGRALSVFHGRRFSASESALQWYVGLSGLLHGLFAAGMLRWLRDGSWEAWVMLAIFAAKLAVGTAGRPAAADQRVRWWSGHR